MSHTPKRGKEPVGIINKRDKRWCANLEKITIEIQLRQAIDCF